MKINTIVGERLDKCLLVSDDLDGFSRSRIQKMIKGGEVLINRESVKPKYVLKDGDEIYVKDCAVNDSVLKSEKLNFEILYEDSECFVLNKPSGIVVHPGNDGKYLTGTVANAVLSKVSVSVCDEMRPGIVHRLDKDTSGALLIAKTDKSYEFFVNEFKNRNIFKSYLALVSGHLEHPVAMIDSPIGRSLKDRKKMDIVIEGGKDAITKYKLIDEYISAEGRVFSLIQVQILTGRTHQIRVHMASIGNPVVCDSLYGSRSTNVFFKDEFGLDRQFLHAASLNFTSPETNKLIKIKVSLPDDLKKVLDQLR